MNTNVDIVFSEAVQGFLKGDFSHLAPLFENSTDGSACAVIKWYEAGLFANEQAALDEAFTCACFNGCLPVVEYLLARGTSPSGGASTGLDALHWAANRGQLDVFRLLIHHEAALETRSSHGSTALGTAIWSALNEPQPNHLQVIDALLEAGAQLGAVAYPTGNGPIDEVLRRYPV